MRPAGRGPPESRGRGEFRIMVYRIVVTGCIRECDHHRGREFYFGRESLSGIGPHGVSPRDGCGAQR
jgi:hypothetical protein